MCCKDIIVSRGLNPQSVGPCFARRLQYTAVWPRVVLYCYTIQRGLAGVELVVVAVGFERYGAAYVRMCPEVESL